MEPDKFHQKIEGVVYSLAKEKKLDAETERTTSKGFDHPQLEINVDGWDSRYRAVLINRLLSKENVYLNRVSGALVSVEYKSW